MTLDSIFPEEQNIPEQYKIVEPIHQKEYLINGEIRYAKGEVQKVLSPVFIKTKAGLVQKELGSYPLLTEKESTEAMNAAVQGGARKIEP